MKVTETLARYGLDVSYKSLPKEVVHQAKRCFLDLIGVALGGSPSAFGQDPLARLSRNWEETPGYGPGSRCEDQCSPTRPS